MQIRIFKMTSGSPDHRWGLQRTCQLCSDVLNDKLRKAVQYIVGFSLYDEEVTIKELTTSQSILLALLYGLLNQDVLFCLNLIEAFSAVVELNSSYMKVWLKDDFFFKQDDVAKAFSNLANLMDCKFPLQLKLPLSIVVAFSGLVDKYKLFDVFNLSGEKKGLEFVKALNSFVLEVSNEVETTLKVEENTEGSPKSAVNDEEVVAGVENGADGFSTDKPTLPLFQPELPTSTSADEVPISSRGQSEVESGPSKGIKFVPRPVASSVIQRKVENGADGSSSDKPTLPLSQPEVEENTEGSPKSAVNDQEAVAGIQRLAIDDEEAASSFQPEVKSGPSKGIKFVPRPVASSVIQHKDHHIYRSLKNAVRHNKLSEIRDLIKPGINVNWETESGERLLHIAVYYGYMESVVTLLQCGAVPEMKNRDSITPLQLAVRLNLPSIFQALLEHVSNINQVFNEGNTILHEIASNGTSSHMDSVLRYKPNVYLKNNNGYTALHLATKSGHVPAIISLIKAGADVNMLSEKGESCLHIVVGNGNFSALFYVLSKANVHYKNPITKFTALHTAAYSGNSKFIGWLLGKGINVNVRAYNNRTALHEAAEQGHLAAVRSLLLWGAEVNAIAKNKLMPLHCAAANGFYDVIVALLDRGAHINAKDSNGNTPRRLAKHNKKYLVEKMLSLRGAKI